MGARIVGGAPWLGRRLPADGGLGAAVLGDAAGGPLVGPDDGVGTLVVPLVILGLRGAAPWLAPLSVAVGKFGTSRRKFGTFPVESLVLPVEVAAIGGSGKFGTSRRKFGTSGRKFGTSGRVAGPLCCHR